MLAELLVRLVAIVGGALLLGAVLIIGRERFRKSPQEWLDRFRRVAPELAILVAVLLVNTVVRQIGPHLSWMFGIEVTDTLYQLEGNFVVWLQSFATPVLTTYFSVIYVYGYVFLLVFPLAAYIVLRDVTPFRTTVMAFTLNYAIGLLCYVAFIAYGPRNILPDLVQPLLYATFPEYQYLTREVNRNTNVLPSLHTSLSFTVLFLAYRTREFYPRWLPVAGVLAVSVGISTMYLGIHWASDVAAGIVLAWVSVRLAVWWVERRDAGIAAESVKRRLSLE